MYVCMYIQMIQKGFYKKKKKQQMKKSFCNVSETIRSYPLHVHTQFQKLKREPLKKRFPLFFVRSLYTVAIFCTTWRALQWRGYNLSESVINGVAINCDPRWFRPRRTLPEFHCKHSIWRCQLML